MDGDGIRKSMRTVLVLAAIAWAAQLAVAQWARGEDEKFVPGTARALAGATLELRGEATITGGEVKLKQVCRWSDTDKAAFEPIADFVVVHMGQTPFRALTLRELKTTLQDGGVNLAVIRFAGTTSCTINRSDVASDERASLQEWVNARAGNNPPEPAAVKKAVSAVSQTPTDPKGVAQQAAAIVPAKGTAAEAKGEYHTLRELLLADIAERLSVEPNSLQMKFNPADDKLLALSEPHLRFNVDGRRIRNLGDVTWDVTILSGDASQRASVSATARMWQDQLIIRKPIAYHQTIRAEDLLERRTLVDALTGEPALDREQVVGQWAGQELKAGTVLTPRLVEAAPLVRTGQLVTITLQQGNVQVTTVARAMEGGSYGQTIRVKNEATNAVYEVTINGPQTARMSPAAASERTDVATVGN
jgi:flagella basal body P-ring formation protein FlgA